jgi:hypothetical protein
MRGAETTLPMPGGERAMRRAAPRNRRFALACPRANVGGSRNSNSHRTAKPIA